MNPLKPNQGIIPPADDGSTSSALLGSVEPFPPTIIGQIDRVISTALHAILAVNKPPGLAIPRPTPFAVTYAFPHSLGGFSSNEAFGISPDISLYTLFGVPFSAELRAERERAQALYEEQLRRHPDQYLLGQLNSKTKEQLFGFIASANRFNFLTAPVSQTDADIARALAVRRGFLQPNQTVVSRDFFDPTPRFDIVPGGALDARATRFLELTTPPQIVIRPLAAVDLTPITTVPQLPAATPVVSGTGALKLVTTGLTMGLGFVGALLQKNPADP